MLLSSSSSSITSSSPSSNVIFFRCFNFEISIYSRWFFFVVIFCWHASWFKQCVCEQTRNDKTDATKTHTYERVHSGFYALVVYSLHVYFCHSDSQKKISNFEDFKLWSFWGLWLKTPNFFTSRKKNCEGTHCKIAAHNLIFILWINCSRNSYRFYFNILRSHIVHIYITLNANVFSQMSKVWTAI